MKFSIFKVLNSSATPKSGFDSIIKSYIKATYFQSKNDIYEHPGWNSLSTERRDTSKIFAPNRGLEGESNMEEKENTQNHELNKISTTTIHKDAKTCHRFDDVEQVENLVPDNSHDSSTMSEEYPLYRNMTFVQQQNDNDSDIDIYTAMNVENHERKVDDIKKFSSTEKKDENNNIGETSFCLMLKPMMVTKN